MVEFSVKKGDVLKEPSDLLLLKYAQGSYGVDQVVAKHLISTGLCTETQLHPKPSGFVIVETKGTIAPRRVMFLGTPPLRNFSYNEMQVFSRLAIGKITASNIPIKIITTTIHGTGYGLKGVESLEKLIVGFREGLSENNLESLERITFMTLGNRSEKLLRAALGKYLSGENTTSYDIDTYSPSQIMKRGDRSLAVKQVQKRLKNLGFDPGPPDGIFGPLTEKAVKHFQIDRRIIPDGVVGSQTEAILFPLIMNGHKGSAIKRVQRRLKELGFDPGPLDGDFGPMTERAVRYFQKKNDISPDGVIGPETEEVLFSVVKNETIDQRYEIPAKDAIFICYRREDSADVAGRIYDRLCAKYGKESVFKDVDSIPIGINFKKYLAKKLEECMVVLAVIGRNWLASASTKHGSRLHDPEDLLHIELECALKREISIIPVLVQGASMPSQGELPEDLSELAYYHGINVRPDPDFHRDMDSLIVGLDRILAISKQDD
jgi:peptidoglycan hydrolase-like protein with peptidoglycan-binding domain